MSYGEESNFINGAISHHVAPAKNFRYQSSLLPFREPPPIEARINFTYVIERERSKMLQLLLECEKIHLFPEHVENNMFEK